MPQLVGTSIVVGLCLGLFGPESTLTPEGVWEGKIRAGAIELRVVIHLEKQGDHFKAKLDSPDQGQKNIAFSKTTFADGKLTLELGQAATFVGKLVQDGKALEGEWKQAGQTFPLTLQRVEKPTEVRRPQTPKPPFPYRSEDVTFASAAEGVTLAGTLTLPPGKGPYPAVVLISGSGPQDRDETLFEHRPFFVLADYLTRQGIVVLRYDDRGVGKSTGKFSGATTADFAQDARGALAFLRTRPEVAASQVGLLGHSEGGLVAPLVAAGNREVAFLVLLAAPGLPGSHILAAQGEALARASGTPAEKAALGKRINQRLHAVALGDLQGEALHNALKKALREAVAELNDSDRKEFGDLDLLEKSLVAFDNPWLRFFLRHDPCPVLTRVSCPVLVLAGEKDLQVDPKDNVAAIQKALEDAGNREVLCRILPGLNHLFQSCRTGLPGEYATIEETLAPKLLEAVGDWIKHHGVK